ncbi:MAG TPA: PepSY domain-containing protein [Streptosporangiaceae bacterium]
MRKNIGIGIGAAAAALALTTGAGAALAASGVHQQAGSAAAAAAHRTITKAQARQIAKAKVPHSRVIEVESDDLHNRPVWKVKLATPHGRVIVDVDKKTGKATIVGRGGHGTAAGAMPLSSQRSWSDDSARDAREDRGDDRGERHDRDDRRGHDRDHDGARHS